MKTILLFIATFLTINLLGQAPAGFNYQAVLRDASGNIKANNDVIIRADLIQGAANGFVAYSESFAVKTNVYGLVNLQIGKGSVIIGSFSTISWPNGPFFIKIVVDGVEMGTSQLLSVPFALYANKAGNSFSGDYNDLTNRPDFAKWEKDSTDNVTLDGTQTILGYKTFSVGLSVNNNKITDLAKPVGNSDAVNLTYLLEKIASLEKNIDSRNAAGIITDFDGNTYNTVKVGSQIWMAENLKTIHYNNGDLIGTTTGDISGQTTPKYQWSYEGLQPNVDKYGRLYTAYAITDARSVCPVGWHIPSDTEWTTLENYLGGISVAGGKMKEQGLLHWNSPNSGNANSCGFFALPGGYRSSTGSFSGIGSNGYFWSSTIAVNNYFWYRSLGYAFISNVRIFSEMSMGYSVRCIKD